MPRTATTPNVILINCDDLGYGDLGCYGSEVHDTPVIDQLAADGVRLTDFYMGSPVCTPSRGAMLTGCYPPRIGFGEFKGSHVLFPGILWAESIGDHDRPASPRRWVCHSDGRQVALRRPAGLPSHRHGFDHWFGIPYSNDMGRQKTGMTPEMRDAMVEFLGIELQDGDYPPLPLMLDEEAQEAQPDPGRADGALPPGVDPVHAREEG